MRRSDISDLPTMTLPLRLSLLSLALSSILSPAAIAQSNDAVQLDRVTVSASTSRIPDSAAALPNTITIIDRQQLDQQLALTQDLSQVLANLIPAFTPSRQKLTNAGENLRGRKPLYLVDGVPQSTPLREGGRDGHWAYGKFAVYPGNNLQQHIDPFINGAFKLKGKTSKASAVMPYYTITFDQDKKYNENVANGYSKYRRYFFFQTPKKRSCKKRQ